MTAHFKCRLLAIDLDGTLLDAAHQVPADNRAALHRAHDAGIKIVLCTGRSFTETRRILDQIGLDLDATVSVFGALVTDVRTGRTISRVQMDPNLAREASAWFHTRGYPVMWLTDPEEVGTDGYIIAGPNRHPAVDGWKQRTPCVVDEVDEIPETAGLPLRLSIIDDGPILESLSPMLSQAFDGRLTHNVLHVPPYNLSLIETFRAGINKWVAVHNLCQRWNIDPAQTAAVGDDVNDLDMVRSAGLGVAMANAKPALKDVADRITDNNVDCGVARLIGELLDD